MRRVLLSLILTATASTAQADDAFEKDIRPLLLQKCISCHGPDKQKAGLRLDSKSGWQTGGDRGPAIAPGKPDDSLLMKAVLGKDDVSRMPPKEPLSAREIEALKKWIAAGAPDPRDGAARIGGTTLDEAKKWWSFQAVKRPVVPKGESNPIDAFLQQKLTAKKLSLSPLTDKRTLLRRVTFDLTGLPPSVEEVEAFLKDDSPEAFAKVVDRLLASPHYGERWGRHWLDLVRYADTAGETSDHPVPHAWRYRNWVIDSFNRDQPFDEFLKEQLAGDLLNETGPPEKHAGRIVATGYLALARRFDFDSDKSMHLTHEDGIDTLGKAMLGLTLGCARCHDHKYDAITARDYYALYGIFESTRFSSPGCEFRQAPKDLVPLVLKSEWDRTVKPFQEKLAKLDADIRANDAGSRNHSHAVQAAFVKSRKVLSTGEIPDGGEKSWPVAETDVKPGEVIFLSITPLKNHGADSTQVEFEITDGKQQKWNAADDLMNDFLAGNPHADSHGHARTWYLIDTRGPVALLPEPVKDVSGKPGLHAWRNGDTPSVIVNAAKNPVDVWTKLPGRSLFAHPAANGNVGIVWRSPVAAKIRITGKIKDAHPGGPDGVGWVLEHFAADVSKDLDAIADAGELRRKLEVEKATLLKTAPKQDVAYAVVEGKAADAKLHLRGDPEKLGDVVPRRWLEVFGGTPLKDKAASGRLELAEWIASKNNPLTARVMVNRIWLHHFGKGITSTPNDFGTRGSPPSHPELLDWLAAEFMENGWSVKKLHRTILLSKAYQQSSASRESAAAIDANNDLYWRFEPRRLSAEEIRDSLLLAGGTLDRTPGEAHPFPPESTWSFSQHVPFSTFYETNKRSVYLVAIRNRRHPFLGLFDGADPNATTPQRQTTTVPTQALYFLNDPLFHDQAAKLAARANGKVEDLFRLSLQRSATEKDIAFATAFLEKHRAAAKDEKAAWAALARVLLASNEFLFVE